MKTSRGYIFFLVILFAHFGVHAGNAAVIKSGIVIACDPSMQSCNNLTVNQTGSGTVTSAPPGISCTSQVNGNATCLEAFPSNSTVTLSAAAGPDSTFTGWSGACSSQSSNPTCVVTMSASESVTASYVLTGTTPFSDVQSGSTFETYIEAIYNNGITTGCGGGGYCPSENVTRDQMAAFLVRATQVEAGQSTVNFTCNGGVNCSAETPYFSDVSTADQFFPYIQKLKELGITTGCGGGDYCPSENVTRDQMAAFLVRALYGGTFTCNGGVNCSTETPYFSDVSTSDQFFPYIQKLKELGITTGCGNGNYCPSEYVTRDQMAAFLARAFLGMAPVSANAGGTYTYSSGTLNLNTTSSTFPCNGVTVGTKSYTGVTITSTTMTWPNKDITWSRTNGTAGSIVGTWTSTDGGNSYTITFNDDGTVTMTGTIVSCSGGSSNGSNVSAYSLDFSTGYEVGFSYNDPGETATSVSVSGPGITGTLSLAYISGGWVYSPSSNNGYLGSAINLGTTYPTGLPFTYTFYITGSAGTSTATSTVSCFQLPFATNISPTGTVTGTPTFSWTGIGDSSATYQVQLSDSSGNNRIWNSNSISGASIAYSGPALTPGANYQYFIVVESSSACSNGQSLASGYFTYQ
jgi:hypothetical protein